MNEFKKLKGKEGEGMKEHCESRNMHGTTLGKE